MGITRSPLWLRVDRELRKNDLLEECAVKDCRLYNVTVEAGSALVCVVDSRGIFDVVFGRMHPDSAVLQRLF